MNPDAYYTRGEVSNSDLTALKNLLHPKLQFGDKEAAFRFGSLVDAMVTESDRVNYYRRTVDDVQYSEEEFEHAMKLHKALYAEANNDHFLAHVLTFGLTQKVSIRNDQKFEYCGFPFSLDTRCKWDWWLKDAGFGGDLKTTFASTEREFHDAIDFFDWDRSRAWYMDIVGSDRDFIYAVSKKNAKVFKHFIRRGDEVYRRGRAKYEELAFQYWTLMR